MDLGTRFRELRRQAGLTGSALARPKYTESYVSQIEAGRRKPSPDAMAFFADRLGVSPDFLQTGIPEGIELQLLYRLEGARHDLNEGRYEPAAGELRSLVEEARAYGLTRIEAMACSSLGEAYRLIGRIREAIDAYEAALEGDLSHREAGMTVGGLGRAYRSVGDLTYAAEVMESFLAQRDRHPLDPSVAADLQSVLVSIYFERGDITRAERAARRALAAANGQGSLQLRAVAYWHASRVLAETRQWDEALQLATRARVLLEEFEDRRRVARLHNAYAFICLEAQPPRIEEARDHLARAESKLMESGSPGDLAYVLTERSRLALLEDMPEEALTLANRALGETSTDELERARSMFLKGRALGILGRRSEACEALKDAAEQFGRRGARQQEAACWREIGELDLAAGDVHAAVEALRAGLEALDPRRSRA